MSKSLPDIYTIRGLRAAQGCVFRDPLSAVTWLHNVGLVPNEHIQILPAEVIYYGCSHSIHMKTTEDIQKEKLGDKETRK